MNHISAACDNNHGSLTYNNPGTAIVLYNFRQPMTNLVFSKSTLVSESVQVLREQGTNLSQIPQPGAPGKLL